MANLVKNAKNYDQRLGKDTYLATVLSSFILQKPVPPAPVVEDVVVGTDLIVLNGLIPSLPADITEIHAVSTTSNVANINFDLSSMSWSISLSYNGGAQAGYSLYFGDADGFSSASTTGTQIFAVHNAPPAPVVPPQGAGSVDGNDQLSIFWDFEQAGLNGVTKPSTSPTNEMGQFRGWLPGTNNASCKITGTIMGGTPPFTIMAHGQGCNSVTSSSATAQFSMNLSLSEGRIKDIQVTATDTNNLKTTSFKRSIYLDTQNPHLPSEWKCSFGDIWPDGLKDELIKTGSGIAQIKVGASLSALSAMIPRDVSSAWDSPISLPRPGGRVGEPQMGDIYPAEDGAAAIPMIFSVIDGAGCQSTTNGVIKISTNSFVPSFLVAKKPFFIGTDPSAEGIKFISQLGTVVVPPGKAGVIRGDVPGMYMVHEVNAHDEICRETNLMVRVVQPQLLVDENNNNLTTDENQDQQLANGALVPLNDDFDLQNTDGSGRLKPDHIQAGNTSGDKSLRLVTFDPQLHIPKVEKDTMDWNGFVNSSGVTYSSNLRLWKTLNKTQNNLILSGKTWELGNTEDDTDYNDFASLNGKFYVECLPDPSVSEGTLTNIPRYIELTCDAYTVRVYIHALTDKNEGVRDGDASVAAGSTASLKLTSGALRCSWPMIRSGSVIMPDIYATYDSLDNLNGEPSSNQSNPDKYMGALGRHFRHNLEMRVIRSARYIFLIDEDGRRVKFEPDRALTEKTDETKVTWSPEKRKGEFSTIKFVKQTRYGSDRSYYVLLRASENKQYLFERETGKLREIRDTSGNVATLEYEEYGGTRGNLRRVADSRGMFLEFNGGGGSISISDPMGHIASISKSGVNSPLGNYPCSVDGNNLMTSFTNSLGAVYTVDQSYGIIYGITRIDGRKMTLACNFASGGATVHNYAGTGDPDRQVVYACDKDLDIWKTINFETGSSAAVTVEQNATERRLITSRITSRITSPGGGGLKFGYDDTQGLLISQKNTDPGNFGFTRTYAVIGNPLFSSSGPNYLPKITLLKTEQDSKGQTTTYGANASGFLSSIADTVGTTTFSAWDSFGLPGHISGPRTGHSQDITYDSLGHVQSLQETGAGATSTTTFKTDAMGRVREITLPDDRKIRKFYDAPGHLIETQGPLLSDAEKTAAAAQTPPVQLQDGGTTCAFYDSAGNWTSMQDADGRTTSRDIDNLGRVKAINDSASGRTEFKDFDALGMPKTVLAPPVDNGSPRTITAEYDLVGRVTKRTLPGGTQPRIETLAYNDASRTVLTTDPRGTSFTQTLLPSGRLVSVQGPLGYLQTHSYDGNGDLTGIERKGLGKKSVVLNQHGLPIQSGIDNTALTTLYQRDAEDAIVKLTLPGNIVHDNSIDALGRLTGVKIAGQTVKALTYNTSGAINLPKSIEGEGARAATEYKAWDANYHAVRWLTDKKGLGTPSVAAIPGGANYSAAGNPQSYADAFGKLTTFLFDSAKRCVGVKDQDSIGATVSLTGSGVVASSSDERGRMTSNRYDPVSGFLIARTYPDGRHVDYSNFDANGNPATETLFEGIDSNGDGYGQKAVYSRKYDELNRVVEETDPAGRKVKRAYNNAGMLSSVTDPAGHETQFTYDMAGRMSAETETTGGITTQTVFAPNGKIDTVNYPDNRVRKYTYDGRGRMSTMAFTGEGTMTYHYNADGDNDTITDGNGKITTLEYDDFHRVIKKTLPVLASGSPSTRVSTFEWDNNGYLIAESDPKGQRFVYTNFDNGRRKTMGLASGSSVTSLGSFTYDGNTPTSDGATSWTLDEAGRIASCNGVQYTYANPLGLLTRKSYGGVNLDFTYDSGGYLQKMADGGTTLQFTQRSPEGRPISASYSNGMKVSWGYTFDRYVSSMKCTQGGNTLYGFSAGVDKFGRRSSLNVQPTGEQFTYAYDTGFRLSTETRNIPGVASTTTTYTYDIVGNRKTKASGGVTETYTLDNLYQLTNVTATDGGKMDFKYDLDGNTVEKKVTGSAPLKFTVLYANSSAVNKQCSLEVDGAAAGTLVMPPTGGTSAYAEVRLFYPLPPPLILESSVITLKIAANDLSVNGGTLLSIDSLMISKGPNSITFEAESATLTGVTATVDVNASGGQAVMNFGHALNDAIAFTNFSFPIYDPNYTIAYEWDALNRLKKATKSDSSNAVLNTGTWAYAASMGWQVATQTIDSDVRSFSWGYGGEMLSETVPSFGSFPGATRTYVNAGVDHVLWAHDGPVNTPPNFFLHDVNGSVYGIANATGGMIERQRYGAFGNTDITSPVGIKTPQSLLNSSIGFQGRTNIPEFDMMNFRNRNYDPGIARFLNRDPLGLVDGPAVYGFCGGDPVNRSDPMGTDWYWNYEFQEAKWFEGSGFIPGYMYIGEKAEISPKRFNDLQNQSAAFLKRKYGNSGLATPRQSLDAINTYELHKSISKLQQYNLQMSSSMEDIQLKESSPALGAIRELSWYFKYPLAFTYSVENTVGLGGLENQDRLQAKLDLGKIMLSDAKSQTRWNVGKAGVGAFLSFSGYSSSKTPTTATISSGEMGLTNNFGDIVLNKNLTALGEANTLAHEQVHQMLRVTENSIFAETRASVGQSAYWRFDSLRFVEEFASELNATNSFSKAWELTRNPYYNISLPNVVKGAATYTGATAVGIGFGYEYGKEKE